MGCFERGGRKGCRDNVSSYFEVEEMEVERLEDRCSVGIFWVMIRYFLLSLRVFELELVGEV